MLSEMKAMYLNRGFLRPGLVVQLAAGPCEVTLVNDCRARLQPVARVQREVKPRMAEGPPIKFFQDEVRLIAGILTLTALHSTLKIEGKGNLLVGAFACLR